MQVFSVIYNSFFYLLLIVKKLLSIIFLFLSLSAFADQPISVLEITQNTQSFWFDDTATIQAALNSHAGGTYTMPVFGTYHISSTLTVPDNTTWDINFNIISTSQTTGQAIVTGHDVVIKNGTINGSWDYTTPANPSTGSVGIKIAGSNVTITNCTVQEFSSSGVIVSGNYNFIAFTHGTISKTGYIGFYCHPELNGKHDVNFSYNFVDRSMISPSTVQEPGVSIRASTNTTTDTLSNVTIANNTVNMPLNPTNGTAECIDMWRVKSSRVDSNSCTGGTIGASVVVVQNVEIGHNHFYSQRDEGIEMLGNLHCATYNNYINGNFSQGGILIDAGITPPVTSHYDTLNYDTVITVGNYGVHTTSGTGDIVFNGLVINTRMTGFYIAQTNNITINNTTINGGGVSNTSGIYFALSQGNTTINGGSILNCTRAVYAYNTNTGAVVDNIVGTNVSLSGTPIQFASFFTNGAHYGSNVHFISGYFTFGPISQVIYGVSNFNAGATSNLAITYTTTGHHSTIVSGLVHITGTGTDTITATTSDTSAGQPLVINKKALVITADSKHKVHGAINPALTYSYSAMAYGETPSVFTSPVSLSTTAVTGSAIGTYPITASGASAANYTFSYVPGVLTVTGFGQPKLRLRIRYH